ncbi:hypothetical protein EHYA_09581 [Embleya hyalina]|uniref:Secreted protein n=1 Tax=Embleya hyalina TaxID=516124 RepID=A0A401Z4N6_9ACTN|nr:hypothetical protein EHYA_09581 [Embleya hyalina]
MSPLQIVSLPLALSAALNLAVAAGLLAHRSGAGIPQATLTGAAAPQPPARPSTSPPSPPTDDPTPPTRPAPDRLGPSTTALYTHDFGHQCSRPRKPTRTILKRS